MGLDPDRPNHYRRVWIQTLGLDPDPRSGGSLHMYFAHVHRNPELVHLCAARRAAKFFGAGHGFFGILGPDMGWGRTLVF